MHDSAAPPRYEFPPARACRLTALVLVASLTGCTAAVTVAEAPSGSDPTCASLVLALPTTLGDLPRRDTTSQASAAWGPVTSPVVLRCGVEPPGPTTDRCVTVETPGGPSIDWITVAEEPDAVGATDWTFTTYGREPAIEVHVPAEVVAVRSTSFLDQLGPAVALVDASRACL